MLRLSLLIVGLLIVINQKFFFPASEQAQTFIFLIGIVIIGIPHGAADLLISMKDADNKRVLFSYVKFFTIYIGRLFGFLLLLLFLPSIGILFFLLIAAFHFGETDLFIFETDSFKGKLLSLSYGLVIINVILLNHFEQVSVLLLLFKSGQNNFQLINWVSQHTYIILALSILFFLSTIFIYFRRKNIKADVYKRFTINFVVITIIVYYLPLLLGFTFYFVLWHSVMSLRNITSYLQKDNNFSNLNFIKQISFYSFLAILGVVLFGMTGFMFLSHSSLVIYSFLGLAVLTAPHVQVMHTMYHNLRFNK